MNAEMDFAIGLMITVIGGAALFLSICTLRRRSTPLGIADLEGLINPEQVEMVFVPKSEESGAYFVIRSGSARISYASWAIAGGKCGEAFTVHCFGKVGFSINFVDEEAESFTRVGCRTIEAVFAPQDHAYAVAFLRELRECVSRFPESQKRVEAS